MFRTRDFVLLFTVIVFLVVSIGATLFLQRFDPVSSSQLPDLTDIASTSPEMYPAMVSSDNDLDRAQRVADMRAKIAAQTLIQDQDNAPVAEEEVASTTQEEAQEENAGVVTCPYSSLYFGFWDARDLSWIDSEGARVLVRGEIGSTSIPESVVQLPKRMAASNNPSCVGSDVIGIANDGSLIRNDEVGLYGVFSSQTLVGYALDGFPIYGVGSVETDACGGHMVAGQYRYEIKAGSESVINCFAATPVALP